MSPSIWTRCGGRANAGPYAGEPWRVTDVQRIASTRPLVDTDDEQRVLEELLDRAKPALPPGPEYAKLHYLLYTPFRYPPLRGGSRFGSRHEQGVWYGAEALGTALAETAYYQILFFGGTSAALAPHTVALSAFQARVRCEAAVDLAAPAVAPYLARLCSPTDYAASQAFGRDLRADAIQLVRFPSARDPARAMNVGLFTPRAFASPRPIRAPETWLCTVTRALDVEFRHERITGVDRHGFSRNDFLVGGALPAPALA